MEQKPILLGGLNSLKKVKVHMGCVIYYCVIDNVVNNFPTGVDGEEWGKFLHTKNKVWKAVQ